MLHSSHNHLLTIERSKFPDSHRTISYLETYNVANESALYQHYTKMGNECFTCQFTIYSSHHFKMMSTLLCELPDYVNYEVKLRRYKNHKNIILRNLFPHTYNTDMKYRVSPFVKGLIYNAVKRIMKRPHESAMVLCKIFDNLSTILPCAHHINCTH